MEEVPLQLNWGQTREGGSRVISQYFYEVSSLDARWDTFVPNILQKPNFRI